MRAGPGPKGAKQENEKERAMVQRSLRIELGDGPITNGLLDHPENCRPRTTPGLVLAHGANNDMRQPLLAFIARHLTSTGVASVLRFNFPYVERGVSSPDPQPVLENSMRRAHDALSDDPVCPPGPLFLGGKSLGARVAAELVSRGAEGEGLPAAGLVFLGFPLHAAGKKERAHYEPLRAIAVPSLFVAGTRDPFSDLGLLRQAVGHLQRPGRLFLIEGGDHSFRVPASAGLSPEDVYLMISQEIARFITEDV
jgi:uncharacterized protein